MALKDATSPSLQFNAPIITIPLKSGKGKKAELDSNFIKVIEYEYAVKYLELMGIDPSTKMITQLLNHCPLSSCELKSGWSNTGRLADVLFIYPNKRGFSQNYELSKHGDDKEILENMAWSTSPHKTKHVSRKSLKNTL